MSNIFAKSEYFLKHNRNIAQTNSRVTYIAKGGVYESILEEAEEFYQDIENTRTHETRIYDNDRIAGCIAEIAFGRMLNKANKDWYIPENEWGYTKSKNGSDYGDFEIDDFVYDIKSSARHANSSVKYIPFRGRYIDYVIGSHIINDSICKSMVVYFYGVLKYTDVPIYDENFTRKCCVIKPENFKPFPFKLNSNMYIDK